MDACGQLVKKFSDFIEHPVVMDVEKKEEDKTETVEETLNAREAIWLRNKSEVKPEEYDEFYKQISQRHREAGPRHPLRRRGEDRVQRPRLHPGPQAVRLD